MAESLGNVLDSVVDQIKIAYKQFEDDEGNVKDKSDFSLEKFWITLDAVLNLVSHEVTKLCIVFSKPPYPDVQQTQSLLKALETAYMNLLGVFYGLPKEKGLTLRKEIHNLILVILDSLIPFVKSLKDKGEKAKKSRLMLSACVTDRCHIRKLSRNNVLATAKALESEEIQVKDALQEMDDEMNVDEDSLEEENKWTNQEREMLPSCVGIVKSGRSCLRKAMDAVLKYGRCETEEEVAQLDDLVTKARSISPAVDDLFSEAYAPIERNKLKSCALVLVQNIEMLLNTIKHSHYVKEKDKTWIRFLLRAVRHNNNKLQPLLES